jgi:hypothetical protein
MYFTSSEQRRGLCLTLPCVDAPQVFARFMLRLVQRGGGSRIKQMGGGLQPLLIEFAMACRELVFQQPLSTAEADALNDVS